MYYVRWQLNALKKEDRRWYGCGDCVFLFFVLGQGEQPWGGDTELKEVRESVVWWSGGGNDRTDSQSKSVPILRES